MLVLVAGMQKSGSGWCFSLVNDALVAGGFEDAREVRDQYAPQCLNENYNPGVNRLRKRYIKELISLSHNKDLTFACKTHAPPTDEVEKRIKNGEMSAIYSFRDPRDVVLSAFDHGIKDRKAGRWPIRGFARFITLRMAAKWVKKTLLPTWSKWANTPGVIVVRYEDMLHDPIGQLQRILVHLGISINNNMLSTIVKHYSADRIIDSNLKAHLHLNKAKIERFRKEMTEDDIAYCNVLFADYLPLMGYSRE